MAGGHPGGDYPGERRACGDRLGRILGGVLGLLLGGQLESAYGWRVAFMTVGAPGFVCAVLVARLADPSRPPAPLTVRSVLRDLHLGTVALLRQLWPLLVCGLVGIVAAYRLDRHYGADSGLDVAALSAAIGLGLAFTIWRLVRRTPSEPAESVFGSGISGAFDEIVRAGKTVLHTPTLVYVFSRAR
jgi:MFS family permease